MGGIDMKIIDGTQRLPELKELIVEYTDSLHMDLSFQNLSDELAHLEQRYVPPYGRIYAAVADDGAVIGCIAYHRHDDRRCEMTRLYVKPAYRHLHAGRMLVEKIVNQTCADGYKEMVLDSFTDTMKSAIHTYERFGFTEIPAYYHNPMPNVIYLKKDL